MEINCPECNQAISNSVQRKMSSFWKGVQPAQCNNCGQWVQWNSRLLPKLKVGGWLFKIGFLGLFVSMPWSYFYPSTISLYSFYICVAFILAGILITWTPRDKVTIEKATNT